MQKNAPCVQNKHIITTKEGEFMFGRESSNMPISFAMEMSRNQKAFSAFLKQSEGEQDEIIERARGIKTVREMHAFVNSIGNMEIK